MQTKCAQPLKRRRSSNSAILLLRVIFFKPPNSLLLKNIMEFEKIDQNSDFSL